MYRALFDVKGEKVNGNPVMTDAGKRVIPGSQIPVATLYKKSRDAFLEELQDENMADLHYGHHQKRRVKNLLRLQDLLRMMQSPDRTASHASMPGIASSQAAMS